MFPKSDARLRNKHSRHPEPAAEGGCVEGWQQAPRLLPSFETRAFALLRMTLCEWHQTK
jgi:hypothetical protein